MKVEIKETSPNVYDAKFYMRDHSVNALAGKLDRNILDVGGFIFYEKTLPTVANGHSLKEYVAKVQGFHLKPLSDQTLCLTIPTFDFSLKPVLDSLLAANDHLLRKYPNLIIDIRYNGGGSDRSYEKLVPYLYTNPIFTKGYDYWTSKANLDNLEQWFRDTHQWDSAKVAHFADLRQHPDQFYGGRDWETKLDSVTAFPKKVVVLASKASASSAENFLMLAKQSKKVTVMGENSSGTVDYGNLRSVPFPNAPWAVTITTIRSRRLPDHGVEKIGIKPDIALDKQQISQWVTQAQAYLEKK